MSIGLLVGAFVAGTSLAALAGNLAEGRARMPARLDRPFVDSNRIAWSLVQIFFAGPYLLVGEVSAARDEGRCSLSTWFTSILFAALWCLASGILFLELLWQIAQHLGPSPV